MLSNFLGYSPHLSPFPTALVTLAVILLVFYYFQKTKGLPPGPKGLPYLGIYPFIKDEGSHLQMGAMTEKYGDIFSFTITGKLYVSLGTVKLIREAHVSNAECFERITDFSLLSYIFKDSVAFVNGDRWKVLRKFFTGAFKDFGMISLRGNAAGPIYDAVQSTVDELRASAGQPVDMTSLLTDRCSSIVRRMLFGEDGISQSEMLALNEAYGVVIEGMTSTKLLLHGNIARYFIIPMIKACRTGLAKHHEMLDMLEMIVARREATFDQNNARDVIDCYFKERNERRMKNDPTAEFFTNRALVTSLVQFVGDGVLSIAIFIGGFLQGLVEHPEEQEKIYQELVEVVGTERLPSMDDKSNLPYLNAFIYEVIRTSEFFPMFPSLICTKDTTLRGFRIPKASVTVINMWSAHHDPLVYDDPFKFNPSRYLSQPGKQRPELPVMFGIGRRSCAGEAFTMMQVFLFLSAIVLTFKVSCPEGHAAKSTIFYAPEKMKFTLHPRHPK